SKLGRSPAPARETPGWFTRIAQGLAYAYAVVLNLALRGRYLVLAICLGFAALGGVAYLALQQEITPTEDRGVMLIALSAQQGSNLNYMSELTQKAEDALSDVQESGEITAVLATIGRGSTNRAFLVAALAPWADRDRTQQEIQAELQKQLGGIPGLSVSPR